MKIRNILLILLILPLLGFSQYVKKSGPIVQILPGQVGVKHSSSGGYIIYKEGSHFINPFHTMHVYDIKIQELSEKMDVLDANGLQSTVGYSFRYAPLVNEIGNLHDEIGRDYLESIIKPEIRSVTRAVIGEYPAQELVFKRREIQEEINEKATRSLGERHINLDIIFITDIVLPQQIQDKLERKAMAEQEVKRKYMIIEELEKLRSELLIYKNELKDCKQNNCLDSTIKGIEQKIENQLEAISSMEKLLYNLNE